MNNFTARERLKRCLDRLEPYIEGLLFFLSAVSILLVVANEFVPSQNMLVPFTDVTWGQFRWFAQTFTWSAFIMDVALYELVSFHFWRYAKEHWGELAICVLWFPFHNNVLLQHITSLTSVQTLVVLGSVCHLIRVATWTRQRFAEHPVVVIMTAAIVLIVAASVTLMQVEPQTFGSFQDSAYFVFMTIFTVGSPLNPTSLAGRIVTCVFTAGGIALGMLFLTTISRIIGQKLFPGQDVNERLLQQLDTNAKILAELMAQQKEAAQIDRERLALLEEIVLNRLPCHGTVDQPPEAVTAETRQDEQDHDKA